MTHAVLLLALLLAVLEIDMTQPVAAIRDAASPAQPSASDRGNDSYTGISSSSSCLFTQKNVNAQDLDAINKACCEAYAVISAGATSVTETAAVSWGTAPIELRLFALPHT
jgi:hypothetical protein